MVGITNHLQGDVTTSTALWETFFYVGVSGGVAVGSLVDVSIGFPLAMMVAGLVLLGTVMLLTCVFPSSNSKENVSDESSQPNFRDLMRFSLNYDMVVYCWIPMVCIGAGANFAEGITTEFFRSQYGKSIAFGGFLELGTMVTYTLTAALLGFLRERWPIVKILGLVVGFSGAGIIAPFIGPVELVSLPSNVNIVVSGIAVNIMQIFVCAVLLNSVTVSALVLSKALPIDTATSLAVNLTNAAYALGSIAGPAIPENLPDRLSDYRWNTLSI